MNDTNATRFEPKGMDTKSDLTLLSWLSLCGHVLWSRAPCCFSISNEVHAWTLVLYFRTVAPTARMVSICGLKTLLLRTKFMTLANDFKLELGMLK